MVRAGTQSGARILAVALAAVALAACGSSSAGPSLSAFRSAFTHDRVQFRQLGLDLEHTIGGAQSKSDAALAAELRPLSARAHQQAVVLSKLSAPTSYKRTLAALIAGFDAMSRDLRRISVAAAHNDAQTAGAATRSLVVDATEVKNADLTITHALGTHHG